MTVDDDNSATLVEPQSTDTTTTDEEATKILFAGDRLAEGPTPAEVSAAKEHFAVVDTDDFVEGLDEVATNRIDCVVTTHSEEEFDGIAFLEAVRREAPELPVVLVLAAGDCSGDAVRRSVDADVTAFIPASAPDALSGVVDAIEENVIPTTTEQGTRMPISDLTLAEERWLKERALDEASVGITITSATEPDNPVIYANDSFVDITGYPHEEVVGANHRFLQGPATSEQRVAELREGIAEHRDVRTVLRNYTKEGAVFWNQLDITPIRDEDGEVSHYIGFQMDVTERVQAKRELEAERETLDRLLDRVNGLLNDVTDGLVKSNSREEIEEVVVDRLAAGEEYAEAWVGTYDAAEEMVTVTQSTAEPHRSTVVDLTDDQAGVGALRAAIDEQSARVEDAPTGLPGGESANTGILVPLTYRSTTYGMLAVFDDDDHLDDRERRLLESLGRSIGTSINDVLTKRTLTTDTVLDITVEVFDEHFLTTLAEELDCTFELRATAVDDGEQELAVLAETDYSNGDALVERAEAVEAVTSAEVLVEDEDGSVVQFRVAKSPLVDILSEAGAHLAAMDATGTGLEIGFRAGTEAAARRAIDDIKQLYDHVELLAYREIDEPERTPRGFRKEIESRLTDRQLTALQKAYVSGFFEWPRRADGAQLAESMDIVPSTYHQHLQAAQRKLVEGFFEG